LVISLSKVIKLDFGYGLNKLIVLIKIILFYFFKKSKISLSFLENKYQIYYIK
jgi:hypothetical protein